MAGIASGASGTVSAETGTIPGWSASGISGTVPTTLGVALSWIGAGGVVATWGWLTSAASVFKVQGSKFIYFTLFTQH